ncbi:hypothetical protein K469DRAFT_741368 [Zopfia rhizophila CBS 207.26]|uniref:Aminoglycoside phosphotransferase domain-containing protein n=1 Tax=Zopfia rhizophila CBS 207.26 TaxID=1314779 RepID=A0A6A6DNX2_9PEZI|nr:hypothetical protein K469DRAFT_741368 [Zopfia rhizophila CBS 207.26]
MPAAPSPSEVASALLTEKGLQLRSLKVLQSLWAGYGYICHINASPETSPNSSGRTSRSASTVNSNISTPQETQSFILKLITPPPPKANDEGHTRKILSYQVEQYFYTHLAPQLPSWLPVAQCLAGINEHHPDGTSTTAMILTDLRQQFPIAGEKRDVLNSTQVNAALDWLSGFHGYWWPRVKDMDRRALVRQPLEDVKHEGEYHSKKTVWLNGGYTYLATRRKEKEGPFSISEMVATVLEPKEGGLGRMEEYQTLIPGDVKSENLFTTASGEQVAFYDFQYTGIGLGVCDLAKLFTCSVPLEMLVEDEYVPLELSMQEGEMRLLERYWKRLKEVSGKKYDWNVFLRHWETALVDWSRFQASWGFWGNTEWLEARVRLTLKDAAWKEDLRRNLEFSDVEGS